jgi:glyoxylase-like metal-dependent hydrolase (beta-lactamase superfamily II)
MHLHAYHIGGISMIIPDTPPNPVAVSRATTPNINNPLKSKVKGHKKRKIC